MDKKQILIITGPTGVGKTDLVLKLGASVPCEIINIDIGQFYKPFAIGTAKPELSSLSEGIKIAGGIPHHLFDILDTPRSLTVHEYRNIVLQTINKVWANDKLPVLVGGSGFYIQSLLFPLLDLDDRGNEDLASEQFFEEKTQDLWQMLYDIDPERAQAIDKQDNYRIKRALEIWQKTGKKPSDYLPQFEPPCDFTFLVVDRDRDELYKRINLRVIEMIDQGWIDEVKKIKNSEWESFLKIKKLIGYDDILNYLDSENKDRDALIENIQQKTRKYAKRQLTFFRMLNSKLLANSCYPSIDCAKHSAEGVCIKTKIIWTNLTLLTDLNTLFASLKN
ncbi:MAG: tRNA (adenosine(37)-N6)-dimethylallyltransferase MiaA [Candidatus Babeliales bacterium]|nr:tRNA (adenosine(37)-N6)-dimethylallyltransferase MiaA [Candidatus Babeliales bacterium]